MKGVDAPELDRNDSDGSQSNSDDEDMHSRVRRY